ncbi:hypothetical protein E4U53_007080 [Claviceps sorghi]|nr:hypothetical protein E4U53_007080 [Claviceps sorghi]
MHGPCTIVESEVVREKGDAKDDKTSAFEDSYIDGGVVFGANGINLSRTPKRIKK